MKCRRNPYSLVREAALALLIFVPVAFSAETPSQSELNAAAARQQEAAQTQTAMAVAASENPTVEAKAQVRSQTETALQDPLENRYSDVRVHDADFNELIVPASKEVLFLKNMVPGGAGGDVSLRLTGLYPEKYFDFFIKADEIVSKVAMTLKVTPSPGLIPVKSHLNVYLNGQLQKNIVFTKDRLGETFTTTFDMNPKLLKDHNQVSIEFIGQSMPVCDSPANKPLWVAVDSDSAVFLNRQKIRIENDLSFLPVPFVDTVTPSPTTLPMVFAKAPSSDAKKAAAIVASWGGIQADWRGIDYPVLYNEAPSAGHFIVFLTNTDRPGFLKDYPQLDAPRIEIADAPNSTAGKMLIIAGRDDRDLVEAAKLLAISMSSLTGPAANVKKVEQIAKRQPYDAPNWVDTTRPIKLREIMDYPTQLSSSGYQPPAMHLNLRLPPDLFYKIEKDVVMDIKYKYSLPSVGSTPEQFRFSVNDHLVDSARLTSEKGSSSVFRKLPVVDRLLEAFFTSEIPNSVFSKYENRLSFEFVYSLVLDGGNLENCRTTTLVNHKVEVDPESMLDFTRFPHYIEMPDINLFINSGFPFTRYADLSETLVLMPEEAGTSEVSTLLNVMGRMGSIVGYPSVNVSVASVLDPTEDAEKEILVIQEAATAKEWLTSLNDLSLAHVVFQNYDKTQIKPFVESATPGKSAGRRQPFQETAFQTDGDIGVLAGFQSPFNPQKSVVAITTAGNKGAHLVNNRLAQRVTFPEDTGNVCLMTMTTEKCYSVGETYFVGHLAWYQKLWVTFNDHPFLIAFSLLIAALLIGLVVYYVIRYWIVRRHA